ncbi:MAG: hypothetical protein LBM77_09415 [Spirochaetaceae bacterium]|jgi:hypothetical protein|nr:hypothetical protein [Spirochaetaceae bacterium]
MNVDKVRRKVSFCLCLGLVLYVLVTLPAFAPDGGGAAGFQFDLALYADALRLDKADYGQSKDRLGGNNQSTPWTLAAPFSNLDWVSDDSKVAFSYQSDFYGGKYTFKKSNITNFGAVQGWVKFGQPDFYLKLSAGNDNSSTYADPLGADPGIRVYTGAAGLSNWNAYTSPDDITGGNGIVLGGYWKGLSLDLAASEFTVTPVRTLPDGSGSANSFKDTKTIAMQYGANVGYDFKNLGDFGKVNASYIMEYDQNGSAYTLVRGSLQANSSTTQVFNHSIGLYGSLRPFKIAGSPFEVTLGYSAVITKYLDYYYSSNMVINTTFPTIWKHGINFNARYNGLLGGALRLRTDNAFTIYKDKDYTVFETGDSNVSMNYNTLPTTTGGLRSEVQHYMLWNGLGVEWDFKTWDNGRHMTLKLYARNLMRNDNAKSAVQKYEFVRNQLFVDLQLQYFFTPSVFVFGGLRYQGLTTSWSKDLAGQMSNFWNYAEADMPGIAPTISDSVTGISIPIGIIISW